MPRLPSKTKETVARLIRRRLRELDRTPEMLATAVQVPEWYVDDLLSGRRLPPAPDRTDIYDKITRYLRLHRNELADRAEAQRAEVVQTRRRPVPRVRELLLELCDPTKIRMLGRHLIGASGHRHGQCGQRQQRCSGDLLDLAGRRKHLGRRAGSRQCGAEHG